MKIIAECIPQDDLDCYYNHEWIAKQKSSKKVVSNFSILQDRIDEFFYEFIKTAKPNNDRVLNNLIRLRDSFYFRSDDSPEIKRLVNMAVIITDYQDLAICTKKFIENGINPFFGIDIVPNYREPSVYTLAINEPSLTLDDKSAYDKNSESLTDLQDVVQNFYDYMVNKWNYNGSDRQKFVKNIMILEIFFSQLVLESSQAINPNVIHNSMRFSEFLNNYDANDFYKIIFSEYMEPDYYISFSNKKFLEYFQKFLKENNNQNFQMLKDYLVFSIVKKYGFYTNNFLELQKIYPIKPDSKSFFINLFYETFGYYLEEIYEARNYNAAKIAGVKDMFHNMKIYCIELFKKTNTFTEPTKQAAIKKLQYLNIIVGKQNYPVNMLNMPDLGSDFFKNLRIIDNFYFKIMMSFPGRQFDRQVLSVNGDILSFIVNAYYDPMANSIFVPTSIMDDLFYSTKAPPIYNYGGLGCIIGHEIMHSFDNSGAKYDYRGFLKNWWTAEDYEKFNKDLLLVKNQYSQLRIEGRKLDPVLTVGENIADITGIKLSLRTYIWKYMPHISSINELTDTEKEYLKKFFERWAQILRTAYYNKSVIDSIETDAHPPSAIRISAPFAHFPEYYKIYGVDSSDFNYLSPQNRIQFLEN